MKKYTITKIEAYKKDFIIWEGNDKGVWYARSQNRNDKNYGRVYKLTN